MREVFAGHDPLDTTSIYANAQPGRQYREAEPFLRRLQANYIGTTQSCGWDTGPASVEAACAIDADDQDDGNRADLERRLWHDNSPILSPR